jgi:hypothetical protein
LPVQVQQTESIVSQSFKEAQMIRAARELMGVYGPRAAAVAEKRAIYLDECGEGLTATTWRQIADAVRAIEARDPARRSVPAM